MIMWTVLTWVFVPGMAISWGVNGAALGYALVGCSSIVAIIIANRFVSIDFGRSVISPLLASIGMGFVVFILGKIFPATLIWVMILVILGILIYFGLVYLLVGASLLSDLQKVWYEIHKK